MTNVRIDSTPGSRTTSSKSTCKSAIQCVAHRPTVLLSTDPDGLGGGVFQRQPILDPKEFRARFKHSLPTNLIPAQSITADSPTPPGNLEPIPPALLAVVIAWGSKFSEHPLILMDRNQNGGRSRISRALVSRAFEIAEAERVYRIPTPENIITCMVIEGIQSRKSSGDERFDPYLFWQLTTPGRIFQTEQ